MESTRQQKVARLVQKELGSYFQQESRTLFGGAMITVTKVHVSKDLAYARIYISLFGAKDKTGLLEKITGSGREIRHHLGLRTGKQLRIIPELHFFEDDSLDYIDRIDNLLHSR
jgi:ribosome-binding factor A